MTDDRVDIGMKIQLRHSFEDIISTENFLEAWKEFIKGKRQRKDVREFGLNLIDNILELHSDLVNHIYKHGGYQAFNISDPKPRNIHKATVCDRLLHRAIYRVLYPFFDRIFIADSFSCRIEKGTHKAIERFRYFSNKASKNNTRTCWVLKCDIRKFFASIDHNILKKILAEHITDKSVLWLLARVIDSFHTEGGISVGLPLGNLTSQLLVNIYMNKLDQFVKHKLKAKYYIRYADDFIILSENKNELEILLLRIGAFLCTELKLELHPKKVSIKTLASGIDFLGWVNFPRHRVLRTSTKKRMLNRVGQNPKVETLNSYKGLLSHGNAKKLEMKITEKYLYRPLFF